MLKLVTNKKINFTRNYSFSNDLEENIEKIFINKKPCIGIAPGAGEKNRQWKIENFIKLFINKGNNHE